MHDFAFAGRACSFAVVWKRREMDPSMQSLISIGLGERARAREEKEGGEEIKLDAW